MLASEIKVFNTVNFKQKDDNTLSVNKEPLHFNLVKSPKDDNFEKTQTKTQKEKYLVRNILLGLTSALILIYGGIVLKRKLTKPTFDEIQRCFKEIFEKDLSSEEVNTLINKYKTICQNGNTEDFTKQMIEQLKIDYGVSEVATELNVIKLKDSSIKTALARKEGGNANPLGEINIMPSTHNNTLIRSIQGETFATGFHELKHIKQFADAYCTDPDKFAEAIYKSGIKEKDLLQAVEEAKNNILKEAQELQKTKYKDLDIDYIVKEMRKNSGITTDDDIKNEIIKNTKKNIREQLDLRYGKLERFKNGTTEYKKGQEYIDAYGNYSDPELNYDAYRENILEKEAWHIGDLAKKIYKYSSSIWKL